MMQTAEAIELAERLSRQQVRVVFAESCTAGLASALLAVVPGISEFLCGSLVTYRPECKQDWLGISPEVLERHSAVSPIISQQMATAALRRTPAADYSAAVTGHLGPNAPADQDGRVYIAVAGRGSGEARMLEQAEFELVALERIARQAEAARLVLQVLGQVVEKEGRPA